MSATCRPDLRAISLLGFQIVDGVVEWDGFCASARDTGAFQRQE